MTIDSIDNLLSSPEPKISIYCLAFLSADDFCINILVNSVNTENMEDMNFKFGRCKVKIISF